MVTPNDTNVNVARHKYREMFGDVEVFSSKSKIPTLYPSAPKGQSIFQAKGVISVFEKNEELKSKSKSKYEARISQLIDAYENPHNPEHIPEPIPYHNYCHVCKCMFKDYYAHVFSSKLKFASHLNLESHIETANKDPDHFEKIDQQRKEVQSQTKTADILLAKRDFLENYHHYKSKFHIF